MTKEDKRRKREEEKRWERDKSRKTMRARR